jgi:hypothetical protein
MYVPVAYMCVYLGIGTRKSGIKDLLTLFGIGCRQGFCESKFQKLEYGNQTMKDHGKN